MGKHFKTSPEPGDFRHQSRFDRAPQGDAPQYVPQPGAGDAPQYVPQASTDDAYGHAPASQPGVDAPTQRGAYVPQGGAYVPQGENNPYVGGPASGAAGFTPQQVGTGHGRPARNAGVPGAPRKRKRRAPVLVVVLVVIAALVGGGAFLYFNPPIYRVSVDGTERMVRAGSTLGDLISEGFSSPKAGNLIAVDGSVATEGGGDPFEANLNGATTADPSTPVPRHSTVTFADGNDVDEEYTETTEPIAHGESGDDMSSFNLYWAGSIHVYSEGEDGEQVTKTGKVSGKTVTEVTKQPVDTGYHVYTADTGDDKVIALTFDDGPWPTTTSEILDVLKENDAHATFFEIGNQVGEHADVVKRIVAEGNQIGTHTYDHASGSGGGVDLTKMSADEQVSEVDKGFQAIESVLGTSVTHVMRAPGGNYHGDIIKTLASHCTAEIGWNIDTEDWRRPGAQKIADAILSAKPGDVVLMHDGGGDRSQTVEALKIALPQLKAAGYKFVTIDELMAYGMPSSN